MRITRLHDDQFDLLIEDADELMQFLETGVVPVDVRAQMDVEGITLSDEELHALVVRACANL